MGESSDLAQMLSLIHHLDDAAIALDRDFHVLAWNQAAEQLYRIPASQAVGSLIGEMITVEEGPSLNPAEWREKNWNGIAQHICQDGVVVQVNMSIKDFHLNGQNIGKLMIVRDISTCQKTEQELLNRAEQWRSAIEFSKDAIIVVGPRGDVTLCNPAAQEMFGYSNQELVGRHVSVLMPETYRRMHQSYVENYLSGQSPRGTVGRTLELTGLRRSGEEFPIELSLSGRQTGRDRFVMAVIRDISERKKAEAQIAERTRDLQILNRIALICNQSTSIDQLVNEVLEIVLHHLNFKSGGLYLYDDKEKVAELIISKGLPKAFYERVRKVKITRESRNTVLAKGQPIFSSRYQEDAPDEAALSGFVSYASIPLLFHGKSIGCLNLATSDQYRFSGSQKMLLITVGQQIGSSLMRLITEEKLRESEEQYRTVIENQGEGIAIVDENEFFTFANPASEEIYGVPSGKLVGRSSLEFVDEENSAIIKAETRQRPGGKKSTYDLEITRPNGDKRQIIVTATPRFDESGNYIGAFGIFRDITERRQTEQALRRSEERYRLLVEVSTDIIYRCDLSGRFTYVNKAALQRFGVPEEEVYKKNYKELVLPKYHDEVEKHYLHQFKERIPNTFCEFPAINEKGEILWIAQNVQLVFDGEKPVGFQAMARDITERKLAQEKLRESEEKYRNLVEMASDCICIIQDGVLRYANPRLSSLLGYTVKEMTNQYFDKYIHPQELERMNKLYSRYMSGERNMGIFETQFVRNDGSVCEVELNASMIGYEGKGAALMVIRDVTDRNRTEAELRETSKRYQLIAQNVNDVIWTMDLNLNYTYLSPSVERMFGSAIEQAMSKPMQKNLTEKSYLRVKEIIANEMAKMQRDEFDPYMAVTVELEQYCADESTLWTEVTATFLLDENETPIGILGVTRDISERRQTEQALRESERRYRLVTESSKDIIWTYDLIERRFTFASSAAENLLGYSGEDLPKLKLIDIMIPETAEKITKAFQGMIDRWPENPNAVVEGLHRRKDGSLVWMEINGTLIPNDDGSVTTVIGVSRDITERKRAEEEQQRLIALIENSHDFIGLATLEGQVMYLNEAGRRMTGIDDLEEAKKTSIFDYAPVDDRHHIPENVMPQLFEGGFWEGEGRIRNFESGDMIDVQIHTFLLRSKQTGEPVNIATVMRDVTEKKRAALAVQASEENFRTLAENAMDGIIIAVSNGSIVYSNQRGLEMTGYSADQLLEKNVLDIFSKEHREVLWQRFRSRVKDESLSDSYESFFECRDGSLLPVEVRGTPTIWKKQPAAMAFIRDITDQKEAEAALRFRMELLRLLMEIATNFINLSPDRQHEGITDAMHNVGQFANADRCFLFLFDPDLTHFQLTYEWHRKGFPAYLDKIDKLQVSDFKLWDRQFREFETIHIPSVVELPLEAAAERDLLTQFGVKSLLAVPVTYSNKLVGYWGITAEHETMSWSVEIVSLLTTLGAIFANALEHMNRAEELKNSEETARAMLNATTDMGLLIDDEGSIQSLNAAAASLLLKTIESLIGKDAYETFYPYVSKEKDLAVFKTATPIRYEEKINDRWLDKIVYPVFGTYGEVTRIAIFAHDITDLKRSERELMDALHRTREAEMLKSRFLANMSHEIRTPLNHIIGLTSIILMQEDSDEEEVRNYLKIVRRSGESLLSIINTVLDLSKIEAGKMEPAFEEFDFQVLIDEMHQRYKAEAENKSLGFRFSPEPKIPQCLKGDAFMLERVLDNLLSNAIKFTHEGWVELSVSFEDESSSQLRLHFEISDSGIGIPTEEFDKIYQSFYQIDGSSTREYRGTGLGLTITREFVRLMGGRIWFESKPSQGTVFHFTCMFEKV